MTTAARLRVVAGKGGVGRTTVTAALARQAAANGASVLAIDAAGTGDLARLAEGESFTALTLTTIDALDHYLKLYLRLPVGLGRVAGPTGVGPLARIFEYVATAAPGVREILVVGKIGWEAKYGDWDEVIVDAPATGHVVELLTAPQTINSMVPGGPLAGQTEWLAEVLAAESTTVELVTTLDELPITETTELAERLTTETETRIGSIVVNRVPEEIGDEARAEAIEIQRSESPELAKMAAFAVRLDERARQQRAQLAAALEPFETGMWFEAGDNPADPVGEVGDALPSQALPSQALPSQALPSQALAESTAAATSMAGMSFVSPGGLQGNWDGLDAVLAESRLVVVAGPGGVGKTTMAAALGVRAARRHGRRVTVVTVDPARRLADALGTSRISSEPVLVPVGGAADGATGRLWVVMVEMARSWDELVDRCAPNPDVADRLRSNGLYRSLTRRFVQSHDYIALDQILALEADGRSDLLVIDTPPSVHALDLLDAPGRLLELFDSRLLRLLSSGGGSFGDLLSRPFLSVAENLLGSAFLADIVDFFGLFAELRPAIVERIAELQERLEADGTATVVVTTTEPRVVDGSDELAAALLERGRTTDLVVANRVAPPLSLRVDGGSGSQNPAEAQLWFPPDITSDDIADVSLAGVIDRWLHRAASARLPLVSTRAEKPVPLVAVPLQLEDPVDVDGLDRLLTSEQALPPGEPDRSAE